MGAHSALICHVLAIYGIAGKFDGELRLAVWPLGLKPPTRNDVTRNDVMHAVAFLAPSSAPLHKHYARSVTNNISRLLFIYRTMMIIIKCTFNSRGFSSVIHVTYH